MFRRSPETTLAAMGAALGLVTFIAGSIFDSDEASKQASPLSGLPRCSSARWLGRSGNTPRTCQS